MSEPVEHLIFDLVAWIAREPRAYEDVMEGWRTSCPHLTVWEDAVDRGLVMRRPGQGGRPFITVTETGKAWLAERAGAACA